MLKTADLEAAVDAGIVTRANADALIDFARTRRAALTARTSEDERFRFLKGFNDVFLTTGVVLIIFALFFMQGAAVRGSSLGVLSLPIAAAVMWGLSEVLVAKKKAVLPGIVLSAAFALFAGMAGSLLAGYWGFTTSLVRGYPGLAMVAGLFAALVAAIFYYARFQFPFALLLIAGTATAAVLSTVAYALALNNAAVARDLWAVAPSFLSTLSILAFMSGLAVFAAAMWFDASDPERLTRRADCGFWLHLAAAPLIVHPLVSQLGQGGQASPGYAFAVFALVAALAIVALAIDRRAILVASLAYLIAALSYLLKSGTMPGTGNFIIPLVLVGSFVLFLGLSWRPLRARVLAPFKDSPLLRKLPPLHT